MHFNRRKKINPLPFIVLIGSLAVIVGSYLIFQLFFSEEAGKLRKAHLDVDASSRAEVQLSGSTNWNEVFNVSVQEGDIIRAKRGQGVKVTFFENSVVYLDENAAIKIDRVRLFDDGASYIKAEIKQGRVWVKVPRKINPRDNFIIYSSETNLNIETTDANFSFAKNKIAMTEGNKISIIIPSNTKDIADYSETLRVGQMISFADEDFEKIKKGEKPSLITMITDEFRNSDWFTFHTKIGEIDSVPIETEIASAEDSTETATGEEVIKDNKIVITKPNNGDDYDTSLTEIEISGTTTEDVAKVIVDDYTLQKFKKGYTTWSYKLSTKFGNLKSKEYSAKAYDEDGVMIGMDSIKINFSDTEEEVADNDEESTAVTSGEFKITQPTEEEKYETDVAEFLIQGTAPKDTVKVVVSGFTLSQFKKGDSAWSYRIADRFGNRGNDGETVTYTVKSYDENDKLIGSDTIAITYKKPIISGEVTRAE